MGLRSHKPVQIYRRRRLKAPFLAVKAPSLLSINKFQRIKLWKITVCQSNILTDRSALSDAVSASLLTDLTMYVTLIFEKIQYPSSKILRYKEETCSKLLVGRC